MELRNSKSVKGFVERATQNKVNLRENLRRHIKYV